MTTNFILFNDLDNNFSIFMLQINLKAPTEFFIDRQPFKMNLLSFKDSHSFQPHIENMPQLPFMVVAEWNNTSLRITDNKQISDFLYWNFIIYLKCSNFTCKSHLIVLLIKNVFKWNFLPYGDLIILNPITKHSPNVLLVGGCIK